MKPRDLTGQKFGQLLVLGRAGSNRHGASRFDVECDCGVKKVVLGAYLLAGSTKSCGCSRITLLPSRNTKHGYASRKTKRAEYRIWAGIIQRCTNPSVAAYQRYGGRGIHVCDEWRNDFARFLLDVGHRPSPQHSIDRYPNNDGHYEPGNVRWATPKEQRANRRDSAPGCKWLPLTEIAQ